MADSWLLSEAAWTAGRATGLMAMSCTEPEEVSKGSTVDLATLSKRIPPSSSSLTATRAHQTHSAQRHRHFCCLLEGKFSKHTFWVNDVLSALEVEARDTFTLGKTSHWSTGNIMDSKDCLSLPQRRFQSALIRWGKGEEQHRKWYENDSES